MTIFQTMIRAEIPQCLPGLRGPFLFWSGPTAGDSPWTVGHHSIGCSRNEVWKRPEIQPQQWLIASFKWGFFYLDNLDNLLRNNYLIL